MLAEQFIAMVMMMVASKLIAMHFAVRAAALQPEESNRPLEVQLSLAPRRLRDHTYPLVEALVGAVLLTAAALVWRAHTGLEPGWEYGPRFLHRLDTATAWLIYLQLGPLLLKAGFVRRRMPLPKNRTDEFRRWRTAWLGYHIRILDASCVFLSLALTYVTARQTLVDWPRFGRPSPSLACGVGSRRARTPAPRSGGVRSPAARIRVRAPAPRRPRRPLSRRRPALRQSRQPSAIVQQQRNRRQRGPRFHLRLGRLPRGPGPADSLGDALKHPSERPANAAFRKHALLQQTHEIAEDAVNRLFDLRIDRYRAERTHQVRVE